MTERKYLGEDGVLDVKDIEYGKLNIIDAPCGCGKTTFVEKKLWKESWWGDLLCLIDSKNGLEAFKRRGERKEYKGNVYYKHEGITAMTYATFAMLCIHREDNSWLWDGVESLIVCDELQSCIKWSKIDSEGINLHEVALKELHRRIADDARVVAISATTKRIREEFKNEWVDMPIHAELHRYEVKNKIYYQNLMTLVETLPADKRGVIYASHINTMIDLEWILSVERGISCVTIWSMNAPQEMNKEDLRVRNSIIEKERIPDDIQVVIINAASETGLNIKSDVDYVVVNSTDEDTVIQVVGRVRHDIDTVYYLEKKAGSAVYITLDRIENWVDKRLYTGDKKKLCEHLNIRDYRGRLCGWTTVKMCLDCSGIRVVDGRDSKGKTYSVLSCA